MNNRQLLIAKAATNYAASKTSSTAETATNPEDLAAGALGIFYMDTTGTWKLVTSSDPTSKTMAKMQAIYLVQGVPEGNAPIIITVDGRALEIYSGKSYMAPVKQVVYIGYDGANGTGVTPTTEGVYTIKAVMKYKQNLPYTPRSSVSVQASAGESLYGIMNKLVNAVTVSNSGFPFSAELISNGTSTALTAAASGTNKSIIIAASGTPLVTGSIVNGTSNLTLTLASSTVSSTNFVVGDVINIADVTYKVAAIGATGTINLVVTLDKPYSGTTLSGATASNFKMYNTTDPTIYGIRLTAYTANQQSELALMDDFEGAYLSYTTNAKPGSGTYSEVLDSEIKAMGYRGYFHPGYARVESPPQYSVSGEAYDLITMTHATLRTDSLGAREGYQLHSQIAIPMSLDLSATFLAYLNTWAASTPNGFDAITI